MLNRITKIARPIVSQGFATKNDYVPFVKEMAAGTANKNDPNVAKFLEYAGEENVIADKEFYEQRDKIPLDQRPTLTYEELRDYETAWKKLSPEEQKKVAAPLQLTGGKGRSLSLMDGVVDVPPGFNVTTAAYFQFVRDNEKVYKKIQNELSTLDTMDDQKRDVVTREIRQTIKEGVCPENIRREVLAQYRDLCFKRAKAAKNVPTTVAVRSSGTKEDIKVESWLPITTGSQAGQSDTFLNCKGEKEVIEKLQACWGSLFTDRAVSYRDDAIFLIFSSLIGFEGKHQKTVYHELVDKIKEYGKKLNNAKMLEVVEILEGYHNPGSVNMMECMQEVLKHEDNAQIRFCLTQLKTAAQEVVHPEQIGIDVVIMQMVQSYISGVLFTVNPPTRTAGASLALYNAWYKNDKSLCHLNKNGEIHSTKPLIVSFEVALGYGENVVGGKVDPDRFVAGTYNGKDWFILEKKKGSKLIQMVNVDESLQLLSAKIPEEKLRNIAAMAGKVVGYEEVGKQISGVLTTHLYGLKYFAAVKPNEPDNSKKQRLAIAAHDIADMLKKKTPNEEVVKFIQKFFKGIQEQKIAEVVELAIQVIDKAKEEAEVGKGQLAEFFGEQSLPNDFILMLKETWENNTFKVNGREKILAVLNVQARQFVNISYLTRSLIDKTFTCNMLTEQVHRDNYCITDDVAKKIAQMAWKIGCYYEEKQDIEFAIEYDPNASKDKAQRCQLHAIDKEGRVHKVNEDGSITFINKPVPKLTEKDLTTMMLYNVQARPYTAAYSTIDFVRERIELVEQLQAKLGQPLARGTLGDNATVGYTLVFDPNKTIDQHAETVKRLKRGEFFDNEKAQLKKCGIDPTVYMSDKTKKLPVVLYLLEADPSHDPLMRLVDAVVTIRGGETCHAAIFCREQGIPAVAGAGKFDISVGDFLVVNAIQGRLYRFNASMIPEGLKFDELLVKVKAKIKPYLIPFKQGDTKCGYILAAEQVAQQLAPTMLARDAAGIALSRAEFKGEELAINVVAGYAYDFILKMKEGTVKRSQLSKFQKEIVEELERHPWIIDQIRDFITNAGYYRFSEYIENGFYYFQNNLGFHLAPDQVNKARAYDFAQDKVQGLIGSEVFSWRGVNPLVGLRGASLEIKDVKYDGKYNVTEDGYQEILGFLLKASCNADRNTHNQGWFYVFIRTERELKVLANIIRRAGKQIGHLPSEIGIMVEVPSNALFIEKLGSILLDLQKDTKQYGVKKVFFSFGTNDYTNLAGKTDREDPRIQNLRILDPAAKKNLAELKKKGYYIDQANGQIPLALEGADILTQLVEHVCAYGRKNKIDLSLCGQAIVKLVEMGLPEDAGKIMSLLNSFGVDPKNRLNAALLRYDSMRLLDKIKQPGTELFKLSKALGKGVVSGELVFVDCDEDLMPDAVKGLEHGDREAKLKLMGLNTPKETSRVGDKIVVLTGKLSNMATFDKKHIDCLDLQYCRAILVAPELEGWDKIEVFDPKKGIAKSRVKGFAPKNIKELRSELEGKTITIDYKSGVVYEGELPVEKVQVPMRTIAWTNKEAKVPTLKMTLEKANDVYAKMKYHPAILLAYRDKKLDKLAKVYDDHAKDLFEDAIKITEEKDTRKRAFLIKNYEKRVLKENGLLKNFFNEIYADLKKGKNFANKKGKLLELRNNEFKAYKQDIEKLLGKKSVEQFITGLFKENMEKALKNSKVPVVHSITTLNCVQMQKLFGGFLVEQVNPNPDYGLLGAARALSDLWEINRWELKALKEVRQKNKNIHLQISDLKGVQSGALVHLWMKVLNDAGLVPGKDGLEVGCNISTAGDTLACVDYMKYGLTFFSFDKLVLGACWGGVDIYWDQWEKVLARRKELEDMGEQSIRFVKSKMEQLNKEGKFGQKKVIQF